MLAVAINNDYRIFYCISYSKLKSNTSENTENTLNVIKINQIFLNGAQQLSSNYFKFQYIETMLSDRSIYLNAGKVDILSMCLYDSSLFFPSRQMIIFFPLRAHSRFSAHMLQLAHIFAYL